MNFSSGDYHRKAVNLAVPLSEIERAYRSKGGLFESANKGQKWLNATSLEVSGSPKITITQDELKNAYTEYKSKIKQKG